MKYVPVSREERLRNVDVCAEWNRARPPIPASAVKHHPGGRIEITSEQAGIAASDPALWRGRTWGGDSPAVHPAPVVPVGTYTVVRPCRIESALAAIWTHEAEPETITGHAFECPCADCARVTRMALPWIACRPSPVNFAALHRIDHGDPVADLRRALGAKPASPQV